MLKKVKPMLPTFVEDLPTGKDWVYEVKYDGFRCILYLEENRIDLVSRNLRLLNDTFPEIIDQMEQLKGKLEPFLPIVLDGELVVLDNDFKANFEKIQIRGRTKTKTKIEALTKNTPVHFLSFDLLYLYGNDQSGTPLKIRKQQLKELLDTLEMPTAVSKNDKRKWQMIPFEESPKELWSLIEEKDGEGIIAKKNQSYWKQGRTDQWLKIKNWKYADFFLTGYEKKNGYFHIGLVKKGEIVNAGLFINGLSPEEKDALFQIIKQNKIKETEEFLHVKPAICVEIRFIEWYQYHIRHPQFVRFRLEKSWEECTWEAAHSNLVKLQ